MGTTVGLEPLVILLDPDLVIFVQKQRHVAIRSGPSARDASPRALNANMAQNRRNPKNLLSRTVILPWIFRITKQI